MTSPRKVFALCLNTKSEIERIEGCYPFFEHSGAARCYFSMIVRAKDLSSNHCDPQQDQQDFGRCEACSSEALRSDGVLCELTGPYSQAL